MSDDQRMWQESHVYTCNERLTGNILTFAFTFSILNKLHASSQCLSEFTEYSLHIHLCEV